MSAATASLRVAVSGTGRPLEHKFRKALGTLASGSSLPARCLPLSACHDGCASLSRTIQPLGATSRRRSSGYLNQRAVGSSSSSNFEPIGTASIAGCRLLNSNRDDCQRRRSRHVVAAVAAQSIPLPSLHASSSFWPAFAAALSKFLGYLVIVGSVFLKVPQILRVFKNKSVEGLNMFSFELESLGYTIALAYCITKKVAFHVYGELFFILAQSLVLMALIYHYSPRSRWTKWKVASFVLGTGLLFCGRLPTSMLETMYNFQTSMFTISRVPQVWSNYKNSSTGELSMTSSVLSVAGCCARLFTSIYAHAPPSMVISSIAGLGSHGVILAQILVYGSKPKKQAD